jgi:hypothetical protein
MRRPGLRATTSVEQLPQRAPGPSRAPCALHGEGPGHVSSCGNFRGTATSACAGAEACARGCMPPAPRGHGAHQQAEHARGAKAWAADARRRPRPPQGAGQFRGRATCACAGAEPCAVPLHGAGPGNALAGDTLRGTARSALARGRGVRPRMHVAGPAWSQHSTACSAWARGQGMRRGCTPKAPGSAPEWGRFRGAVTSACARGRAVRCAAARRRPRRAHRRAATSGEQLPQPAPGAEPCAVPLHGEGPGKRAREIRRTATAEGWDEACAQRDASQVLGPCSLVGGITRTSGRPDARSSPPGRRRPGSTGRSYRAARARAAP